MAINTAERRNSAFVDAFGGLPLPDGTVSGRDRATMLGQYSGQVPDYVRTHARRVSGPAARRVGGVSSRRVV
jgi:hypothetical protein